MDGIRSFFKFISLLLSDKEINVIPSKDIQAIKKLLLELSEELSELKRVLNEHLLGGGK